MSFGKLEPAEPVDAWIPTFTGMPVQPRLRMLSPQDRQNLDNQLKVWIRSGIVEPSTAAVSSNPVFVPKKNGSIRVCVDYRPINAVTQSFDWPLPRIMELRHALVGARVFSRLDLVQAFMRIRIPQSFRAATTFHSHLGKFQFTKMPFGLKTAPSVFQRYMDYLLRDHQAYARWYIDDILIFSAKPQQHPQHVRAVRKTLLQDHNAISEEKSEYSKQSLVFCGILVGKDGIAPSPSIQEIQEYSVPYTLKDRQSFLGFANYFRDFIPGFSERAAPLYPDRRNIPRSAEYEKDFRLLLTACMHAVTLTHWDDTIGGELFSDASKYAAGAVLVQRGKVIAVFSKTFTQPQTRYSATDREHYALMLACEAFRVFIQSEKSLSVRTDHQALLNRSDERLTDRQVRWKYRILQSAARVTFVSGESNPADYWSRKGSCLGLGGQFFA